MPCATRSGQCAMSETSLFDWRAVQGPPYFFKVTSTNPGTVAPFSVFLPNPGCIMQITYGRSVVSVKHIYINFVQRFILRFWACLHVVASQKLHTRTRTEAFMLASAAQPDNYRLINIYIVYKICTVPLHLQLHRKRSQLTVGITSNQLTQRVPGSPNYDIIGF